MLVLLNDAVLTALLRLHTCEADWSRLMMVNVARSNHCCWRAC